MKNSRFELPQRLRKRGPNSLFGMLLTLVAIAGCTPETNCDVLAGTMAPGEKQTRVVAWVTHQAGEGRLAQQFAIPSRVPRPGAYAIRLDPSLGLGTDFEARVISDTDGRPTAVFIGNAAYRGFVIELVAGRRHFGLPANMPRLGDRVGLLCVARD